MLRFTVQIRLARFIRRNHALKRKGNEFPDLRLAFCLFLLLGIDHGVIGLNLLIETRNEGVQLITDGLYRFVLEDNYTRRLFNFGSYLL